MKKDVFGVYHIILFVLIFTMCFSACTEEKRENGTVSDTDVSVEGSKESEDIVSETETAHESSSEITETEPITECNHDFGDWETVTAAGCTVDGEEMRSCFMCAFAETRAIGMTGHTDAVDAGIAAECTKEGLSDGAHCAVCGEITKAQTVIEMLGHDIIMSESVAATCTSEGLVDEEYCGRCGVVLKEGTVIPKTDHVPVVDAAVAATEEKTGLTEGSHCKYCGKIIVEQEVTPVLKSRNGGYITTKKTTLKAEHVTYTIPKNVFVRDDLIEWTNIITDVMEDITGFRFEGKSAYSDGVVECEVNKRNGNEYGGALAWPGEIAVVPFNLFIGVDSAIYHELVHTLQFAQSKWRYSELAMEGFAVYTTYKSMVYLEEHYPEIAFALGSNELAFHNMTIKNYEKLYEQPMEYWLENIMSSEYSSNGNYVIGFRFMWYLDDVYGNYTDWITEYEKLNPYKNAKDKTVTAEMEAEAFKLAYGDDVFENFYPWLREREKMFETPESKDISNLHSAEIYPRFVYAGPEFTIPPFIPVCEVIYSDLTFDLEPAKFYFSKYKGMNVDSLILKIDEGVAVELYDYDGNLIGTKTGPEISLAGVSSMRLAGEGTLTVFKIEGYY